MKKLILGFFLAFFISPSLVFAGSSVVDAAIVNSIKNTRQHNWSSGNDLQRNVKTAKDLCKSLGFKPNTEKFGGLCSKVSF